MFSELIIPKGKELTQMLNFFRRSNKSIVSILLFCFLIYLVFPTSAWARLQGNTWINYDSATGSVNGVVYSDKSTLPSISLYDPVTGPVNLYSSALPYTSVSNGIYSYQFSKSIGTNHNFSYATIVDDINTSSTHKSVADTVHTYRFAPLAPVGISGTNNGNTVTLTWSPSAEHLLSGYNVYVNDVKVVSGGNVSVSASTNQYSFTGQPGIDYKMEVTAVDTDGYESYKSASSWVAISTPPAVPKGYHIFGIVRTGGVPKNGTSISIKNASTGEVLYTAHYGDPSRDTAVGKYIVTDQYDTQGKIMNGLSYSFDMPQGNYLISVNQSYYSTVHWVTTNTTNTYSGLNGLYYMQDVPDINLDLSFVTRPQWQLSNKTVGTKLQPGENIISFIPSSSGANWLYVVFPGDANENKTTIFTEQTTASDFTLLRTSDNSIIPLTDLDINASLGRVYLKLGAPLEIGQEYMLKMSSTSSGNEIQLPSNKTNQASAKLWTTAAKDSNSTIDDYDFTLIPINSAVPQSRPTGLDFSVGTGTITLTWNPNPAANIKGYYIFQNGNRSSLITGNSYTIQVSQSGSNTFYVSAVDTSDNESYRSDAVNVFVPGYSQVPALHLQGKLKGYTLQAGDPIVTFKSQTEGTKLLFINFPYERRNVTSINSNNLVPGDFSLVKISDGSSIGIDSIETNPYGNFGALHLYLHQTLESGQQYQLKMSSAAAGNEITLPNTASNNYTANIVEKDALRNNLNGHYFYHIGLTDLPASLTTNGVVGGGGGFYVPLISTGQQQPVNDPTGAVTLSGEALKITDEKADDGRTFTKVVVDGEKLSQALQSTSQVTIEIGNDSNAAKVELSASSFAAAAPNTVINFKMGLASYSLPVQLIDVSKIAAGMGTDVKELKINVTIQKVNDTVAEQLAIKAQQSGLTLLGSAVDFSVTAQTGDKSEEISNFGNIYVARTIVLAQTVDTTQTTAVWYNPETGEMQFVPSVFSSNGTSETVTILRPGNSIYTVVQNKKTFADLNGHWAKDDIELLASKLVVKGVTESSFAPDEKITRAQFASLLVRSLGLSEDKLSNKFSDVSLSAWYAGAVGAASKAGLIEGYADGTFRPGAAITREQMAAMTAKAIAFAGKVPVNTSNTELLNTFKDQQFISGWAQQSVALNLQLGIIQGSSDNNFSPSDNATRAQSAVILKRLLQYLKFIN